MSKRVLSAILMTGICGILMTILACEDSDTIPPDGSTIVLSATPAQIVLDLNGVQSVPVTLLATVRNSLGIPLPGQDVRFTTTSGVLTPTSGTSVETGNDGNAISILEQATVGPTITATAGTAMDTLTLTAATGTLSSILLSPGPLNLSTCSDTFPMTATALNPQGDPIDGVTLFFEFVTSSMTEVTGMFSPVSGVSGSANPLSGEVTFDLIIDNPTCSTRCIGAGMDCSTTIQATDQGGTIISNPVTIQDQIP